MIFEPDKTSYGEYEEEQKEKNEHQVTHFMCEITTIEVLALTEEIESELFNISFIDYEENDAIKGILSEILWYSVFEESLEYKGQYYIG